MVDFEKYHVSEISKDLVENYINEKRQKTPRLAKDLFLLIRAVLTYAKDKKGLIKKVSNFDLKFQKKKRGKMNNLQYGQEWNNNEYVFLNTIGTPYVPERLTKKITEFI